MAKKKTINTFEGGVDQDTDKKLVKPNTYFSLKNGTLTKDGNEGVITTFKDFKELTGSANLNLDDDNILVLKYKDPISSGEILFNILETPTQVSVTATSDINTFNELYDNLNANINLKVYKNKNEIFVWLNNQVATSLNSKLTLVYELNNSSITKNLGLKEIALENNKRLIFLFRQGTNDSFYIQVIHYNDALDLIYNTDFIFKGIIPSGDINSDNIIYNKESGLLHRLYWNDGINADKSITFNLNIDPDFYNNWDDYILENRNKIYNQFNNFFNENNFDYFPQPYLYDISYYEGIAYDNENIENADPPIDPNDINIGRLKPTEKIVCFYRLKQNNLYSNISLYSKEIVIPTNDINFNSIYYDLRYNKNSTQLTGGEFPIVSRWSTKFEVPSISTFEYNFIEIFVIHYNKENSYKIRKVSTQPLTDNSNIINYNEDWNNSTLQEFTLEELLQIKNNTDVSKNQIIYKNRRIKSNLKSTTNELLLNYDARAYRFNSIAKGQNSLLLDKDGNEELIIDGTNPDYNVDENLDLINPYNDEYTNYLDWETNQQYKFQSDGVTEGGSGLNVSYEFQDVLIEDTTIYNIIPLTYHIENNKKTNLPSGTEIHSGFKVPITKKIFQGGEVYRAYLNFWEGDTPTLCKWIGDIKIPENSTPLTTNINDSSLTGKTISFTINVESIKNKITAFSIGIVPREKKDKSVIITTPEIGLAPAKLLGKDFMCFDDLITSSDSIDKLYIDDPSNFASGTVEYINNLKKLRCIPFGILTTNLLDNFEDDFFMKRLSSYSNYQYIQDTDRDSSINLKNGHVLNKLRTGTVYANPELISINKLKDVIQVNSSLGEFKEIDDLVPGIINDEFSLSTRYFDNDSPNNEVFMPEQGDISIVDAESRAYPKCLIGLDSNTQEAYRTNEHDLISIRKKITNQYGGATFESRNSNIVEISSYTEITNDSSLLTVVPEGDSFINYHDEIISHGYFNNPLTTHEYVNQHGFYTFVESSINFASLDDNTELTQPYRFFNLPKISYYYAGGLPSLNMTNIPNTISFNKGLIFPITTPLTNNILYDYISTIKISNKKILGQTTDSWQIFPVNNEKIIDPNWGAINKLIDEKDRLIIFQENAIAQQYVDQVQQNINDISEISLGTGDVAGQHVYLLKNTGVQSNDSVIQLNDDVIFQDLIRNKIITLNEGEIKGLSNQLIKDDYIGLNRRLTYDRESNIVFIPNYENYLDDSSSSLVVYDNNIKRLTSNETFVADFGNSLVYTGLTNLLRINTDGKLNIFNKADTIDVSNLTELLELSFIVNPEPNVVKTFDNLFIDFETLDENLNDIYDFKPSFIKVQTQYQDTGFVETTTKNLKRRGRTWHFTIPRSQTDKNRIRDYYAIVTLKFPATANRIIKITNVVTSYRSSNLS